MSGIGPVSETPTPVNLWIGPYDPAAFKDSIQLTANIGYYASFQVFRPVTVSFAKLGIAVQAGNLDVGIYDDTNTKIASSGSTACGAGSTTQQINFTAPVTLLPGRRYWSGVSSDATPSIISPTVSAFTFGSPSRYANTAASFPLPAGPISMIATSKMIGIVFG